MKSAFVCLAFLVVIASPVFGDRQDLSKYFKNQLRSEYFIFHYNDEIKNIRSFASFCDGFIGVINREFFIARCSYPMNVFVLADTNSMKKFMIEKVDVSDPPDFGIYIYKINGFITRQDSGYGTFAHEIMHPLIKYNLQYLPEWADEGIPAFFEKFFGYYENNSLVLEFGFQNPWRIKELGNKLKTLNLEEIIKSKGKFGTCEKRMVSVFLYKHGKFKRYLNLIKINRKNGYDTFLEAAFDKKMSEIIPLWQQYLNQVDRDRDKIMEIPQSWIFKSKQQFEKYMSAKSIH